MKTITQILGHKTKWAVIDEDGNVLEIFKRRTTAEMWISKRIKKENERKT